MYEIAQDILTFWIDEVGPKGWYQPPDGLDDMIRDKYEASWADAQRYPPGHWACNASDSLAALLLLDQFPRNMFRDQAKAFASDAMALKIAKHAITRRHDVTWQFPARQFFYMPFMHSEILSEQERAVRLFVLAGPEGAENLIHAQAHRWIIRQFGRFPYRNKALGRATTPKEAEFLEGGGYQLAMQQAAA